MPNFMLIREYLGVSGPETRKIAKIANFNPLLMLVKSVGFMWVIGLEKLLTFGAIGWKNL